VALVSPLELEYVISTSSVVAKSPRAYDLLMWAAKRLDMTKVSSQQDLTNWLRQEIIKQSRTYRVSPKDFANRFIGMVKFFTDPSLGFSVIKEVQMNAAYDYVEEAKYIYKNAKDIEDLYRFYLEAKETTFPPLAPKSMAAEYQNYLNKIKAEIAKVTRSPEYRTILNVLKEVKPIIRNKEYQHLPSTVIYNYIEQLKAAKKLSEELQQSLGLKYKINQKSINQALRVLNEAVRKKRILRRRPLRITRRRLRW